MKTSALLVAMLLFATTEVLAQAQGGTFKAAVGGIRYSCTDADGAPLPSCAATVNLAPEWHGALGAGTAFPTAQALQKDIAFSLNLNELCTDPEGATETISILSGSVTGLSLSAGIYSGTPTVAQAPTVTFRCSDGTLNADQAAVFTVSASPDTTPPAVPTIPTLITRTATTATLSVDAVTDPSGVCYKLYRTASSGGTPALKGTFTDPNALSDATLTATDAKYYTVSAIDNPGGGSTCAGNESARGAELLVGPYDPGAPVTCNVNTNLRKPVISFEGSDTIGDPISTTLIAPSGAIPCKYSNTHAREGARSALCRTDKQFPLSANTSSTVRSEMNPKTNAIINTKGWFGFSVYIEDRDNHVNELFSQPNHGQSTGGNPEVNLVLKAIATTQRLQLELHTTPGPDVEWDIGAILEDQWMDFVIEWVPSISSATGMLKLWYNGALKVNYTGQTIDQTDVDTPSLNIWKLGIYKSLWKFQNPAGSPNSRTVWSDAIRSGTASATYADVAPCGGEAARIAAP